MTTEEIKKLAEEIVNELADTASYCTMHDGGFNKDRFKPDALQETITILTAAMNGQWVNASSARIGKRYITYHIKHGVSSYVSYVVLSGHSLIWKTEHNNQTMSYIPELIAELPTPPTE